MVLLNELSKFLVCRSSLTQSSDFLYNAIDIGGELVATLLMMLFTGWCCVKKNEGNEEFSRSIPENKLKVISY